MGCSKQLVLPLEKSISQWHLAAWREATSRYKLHFSQQSPKLPFISLGLSLSVLGTPTTEEDRCLGRQSVPVPMLGWCLFCSCSLCHWVSCRHLENPLPTCLESPGCDISHCPMSHCVKRLVPSILPPCDIQKHLCYSVG